MNSVITDMYAKKDQFPGQVACPTSSGLSYCIDRTGTDRVAGDSSSSRNCSIDRTGSRPTDTSVESCRSQGTGVSDSPACSVQLVVDGPCRESARDDVTLIADSCERDTVTAGVSVPTVGVSRHGLDEQNLTVTHLRSVSMTLWCLETRVQKGVFATQVVMVVKCIARLS